MNPPSSQQVNREQLVQTLAEAHPQVPGHVSHNMLEERGLLIAPGDYHKTFVPFKFTEGRPQTVPTFLPAPKREHYVYIGRRKIYSKTAGLSLALFPLLQCRLFKMFNLRYGTELPFWKNGINIATEEDNATAIVESHPEYRCVDTIVEVETDFITHGLRLLEKILQVEMEMVDDLSPGSDLEHTFLSGRELSQLFSVSCQSAPTVQYTKKRVEMAGQGSGYVTDGKASTPESLKELFLMPGEADGE